MTGPKSCPPAPGPLEGYAARFDDLFTHVAQRRGFREYLAGLLAPRDRNKTLTALAGAEPVAGAGRGTSRCGCLGGAWPAGSVLLGAGRPRRARCGGVGCVEARAGGD
jgi:hypothetical protein